jgi:hypothetical protein
MKPKYIPGGWMDWINNVKVNNPDRPFSYREMMGKYIKGVKWENAFDE